MTRSQTTGLTSEQRQTRITLRQGIPKLYQEPNARETPPDKAFNGDSFQMVKSVLELRPNDAGTAEYKVAFDRHWTKQDTYTVPADLVGEHVKITTTPNTSDKGKKRADRPSDDAMPPPEPPQKKARQTATGANSSVGRSQSIKDAVAGPKIRDYGFCALCFVWTADGCSDVAHVLDASLNISKSTIRNAVLLNVIPVLSTEDILILISEKANALLVCPDCHRRMDGTGQPMASYFFCPPMFILKWILNEWADNQVMPLSDSIAAEFRGPLKYHIIPQSDSFNFSMPPPENLELTEEWMIGTSKSEKLYRLCSRQNKPALYNQNPDGYPPNMQSFKDLDRDEERKGPLLWDLEHVGLQQVLTALFARFNDINVITVPDDRWYKPLLRTLMDVRQKLVRCGVNRTQPSSDAQSEPGPTGGPQAPREPLPGPSAPCDPPPSGAAPDGAHNHDRHASLRAGTPQWWAKVKALQRLQYGPASDNYDQSDCEESDGASLPSVDITSWLSQVSQGPEQCEEEQPHWQYAHDTPARLFKPT
ncbi:hypothetical protein C8F01DRAFT_1099452 [Mycena amicta]|nr:hypothetical protein C8F01DRAFT_1099452 [Mycena amicta]